MAGDDQKNHGDLPEPADDHDRKLLADVRRQGWHVIAVEDGARLRVEDPQFQFKERNRGDHHSSHCRHLPTG